MGGSLSSLFPSSLHICKNLLNTVNAYIMIYISDNKNTRRKTKKCSTDFCFFAYACIRLEFTCNIYHCETDASTLNIKLWKLMD